MFDKRMMVICVLSMVMLTLIALQEVQAEPGHPQRPDKFTSEEQLRNYLRELKQYYEDNVRIGRFGKRNYLVPAMYMKTYPKRANPEWKNEDDYYTNFNI